MSLDEARTKIDRIDAEIIRLLDERAGVGREIGEIKRRLDLPPHNPGREHQVIQRLLALSDGSMPARSLAGIYRVIMAETLALQTEKASAVHCGGHDGAGKRDVVATVVENVEAAPGFRRMRLLTPELAEVFAPGQFFQIRVGGTGSAFFLRRPFAPAENTSDGLAFYYAVVGGGTRALADLQAGATVGVLAPLGNAYSLTEAGTSVLLAGGGCGAPSLAPLARALRARGVRTTVLLGARTSSVLLDQETFGHVADRLIIATDDGSMGCRGTVVDACRIAREDVGAFDRIYACGPLPMLRAVAGLAREHGVACEVSLEERMACGFGACMGCVVPVLTGDAASAFRRVCHDGPVFDSSLLAWDEMR